MRVVDLSVPALGFKAHDKQVFKVLATYDGLCNCTKVRFFLFSYGQLENLTSCFVCRHRRSFRHRAVRLPTLRERRR